MEQHQRLAVLCKGINSVHIELYSQGIKPEYKPIVFLFINGQKSNFCCEDSNTFLMIFSQQNPIVNMTKGLMKILDSCHYSDYIEEACVKRQGLFERGRYCVNKDFIIKEYTNNLCSSKQVIVDTCDVVSSKCDQIQ